MYVLGKNHRFTSRMYMYMGPVSGLALGATEAVRYSPSYPQSLLSTVVWRLLTDSLFHACTAAIASYFMVAGTNPKWRLQLIAFGVSLVAVIHGFNDRYSEGWAHAGNCRLP